MKIETENTHIVPRWEKERNCWCLSTLWVAGEEQLKYGNRYQLGRKKFWIYSINRSYLYSITSLWTGGRYIGRSWNFMRGGYHYPCWPCKVFYFSSPFLCNSVCASKNLKSLFFYNKSMLFTIKRKLVTQGACEQLWNWQLWRGGHCLR